MRNPDTQPQPVKGGFALPAVLVVVGGLLILAIGILLIAGIERNTARSFVDRERAELAARAGLEDIRGILNNQAANDDFLILESKHPVAFDANSGGTPDFENYQTPSFLFLARGKPGTSGSFEYSYRPLFSATSNPANKVLSPPDVITTLPTGENQYIDFQTLPYRDEVRAAWLPVRDESGRTVGRYAYWVEDLQARVDPLVAGNEDGVGGIHVREPWPFPAPGLDNLATGAADQANLNQIALYAMDPSALEDKQGTVGKTLFKNRRFLISPESSMPGAGFEPALVRLTYPEGPPDPKYPEFFATPGQLSDPAARAVEEGLFPGLKSYKEQPIVPFEDGIDASVAGQPKLNLNKLLATGGDAAVTEMADFIKKALPKFEERKGGFPEDYYKTLAANAIDYADSDSAPMVKSGQYRGLDANPLVSEFLMRFRWENVLTENGRKFLVLSASTYVELWNMSSKDLSGDVQVSYETKYRFPLGANPEVTLEDMADATPALPESDGYRWFPPQSITLKANEYRVIRCGTVTYKIDAGPSSVFIPSPLVLEGETYGSSGAGYRMRWNGVLVDQSRGGLHRNNSSLNYPSDTTGQPRQRTRTTIPSHSHTRSGNFVNNMGDPRMSYYNACPQDANVYPDNYSPNRRNIRWGTIYNPSDDGPTKPKVYGRVMPSEWPDGGHNSTYESNAFYTTDQRVLPDDPRFFPSATSALRNPSADEAPMRLSNLGRFYSATELGRVYDPVMWLVSGPASANGPWGDVLATSTSSTDNGGGNTLRIGRPEHARFNKPGEPGLEAWRLLDLFHTGLANSQFPAEREGPLQTIKGHVNLNTATHDVIRALVVGALTMDPKMTVRTSENHNTTALMAPPVAPFRMTPAQIDAEADRIANAILRARKIKPFATSASIADILDADSKSIFGKPLVSNVNQVHLTDSAQEELFARIYESTTVRSRNFRIWVVGQAISPLSATAPANTKPEVLAEVRRAYTVFADPGDRRADGTIDPTKTKLTVVHENDF